MSMQDMTDGDLNVLAERFEVQMTTARQELAKVYREQLCRAVLDQYPNAVRVIFDYCRSEGFLYSTPFAVEKADGTVDYDVDTEISGDILMSITENLGVHDDLKVRLLDRTWDL